jgi:hypothetical protein
MVTQDNENFKQCTCKERAAMRLIFLIKTQATAMPSGFAVA